MNRTLSFLKGNPLVSFGLSVLAVLIVWFAVANWLDDLTAWLPWSDESRLERQTNRANTAESDASARTLEAGGERAQAERVETYHTQVIEVRDFTARAEIEARSDPDANDPIPASRANRLHNVDRLLCQHRPSICRAAAPVDPGPGGEPLPSGRAAAEPDGS